MFKAAERCLSISGRFIQHHTSSLELVRDGDHTGVVGAVDIGLQAIIRIIGELLLELVIDGSGQLAMVLVGHPKLKNDLGRPMMAKSVSGRFAISSMPKRLESTNSCRAI